MTSEKRIAPPPSAMNPELDLQPRPAYGRIANLLILVGVLVLVFWAGLKLWRVYEAAQSLLALQEDAGALMTGGINSIDPDAAEALILRARGDIITLNQELSIIRPLAPHLGWVPRLGPTLVASPYLLDMADAGSEAGAIAVTALKPALPIIQSESFSASRLGDVLPILSDAVPELAAANDAFGRLAAARAGLSNAVDEETLPWRVRQLLELSDKWLPAAEDGLRLAPALPLLLGQDGPRRYLIMAQNEDELRATGGFITGAGVVTVQSGQIIDLKFSDSSAVDNWLEKPYAFPPQPYFDFMNLELFGFRDANYWPDFRQSAQKAMDLYEYGSGDPPFDGAIAIDQEFLRLLVDATGPVPVPGTGQTISANNLLETLRSARDIQEGQDVAEWVSSRKDFLGGFAAAIQAKLETDFSAIDPAKLLQNMTSAAEQRHLLIYMDDPELAGILDANHWDGRIPEAPPGDFLMVVDTNMGYNKANVFVERALNYEVALSAQPEAKLTVAYRHTGPASEEPCFQSVDDEFEEAAEYLAIADQCYWNYLRIYTPLGSQLIDSSRHIVPGETLFNGTEWDSTARVITGDLPWLTGFSNFLLLPRAGELSTFFHYALPPGTVVQTESGEKLYQLDLFKQPGMSSEKATVIIQLPEGATLLDASPTPARAEGNRMTFEFDLTTNEAVSVRYE